MTREEKHPFDRPEVLKRLQSGDRLAFAALVAAFRRPVINIGYRFFLDQQDAEDIAQEVFIEVFQSLPGFKGDSKISTWIYRITVSKSLDEIKRRNRKKRISSVGKILGLDQVSNWLAGPERPDAQYEMAEDFAKLLDALSRLPDNQRIALTLSKIEDHSNQQIAEIMDISLTAVDSLIYRAKQNLKSFLAP